VCTPFRHWGSVSIAPLILHIGTTWSCVVSFTPWHLYPREKPWYQLCRRLSETQTRFGHCEGEISFLFLLGMELVFFGCTLHSLFIYRLRSDDLQQQQQQQDRHCMYSVTLRCFRAIITAVEQHWLLHIPSMCV